MIHSISRRRKLSCKPILIHCNIRRNRWVLFGRQMMRCISIRLWSRNCMTAFRRSIIGNLGKLANAYNTILRGIKIGWSSWAKRSQICSLFCWKYLPIQIAEWQLSVRLRLKILRGIYWKSITLRRLPYLFWSSTLVGHNWEKKLTEW